MRLRELSERIRETMENDPEGIFGMQGMHALVQDIRDVATVYRPIDTQGKRDELLPWISFSFEPFAGLIEPFNVYPGRFWAMVRVHKQPSGLPELVVHVTRELPGAQTPSAPDLHASFSNSPKVETVVKKAGKDPIQVRLYHRGALMLPDRTSLPAEYCLPGLGEALPQGFEEDGIPGVVEVDGQPLMYLGELMFYNQGRTPDRARLRTFVLNCVAVATVARYVRDVVQKSLSAA